MMKSDFAKNEFKSKAVAAASEKFQRTSHKVGSPRPRKKSGPDYDLLTWTKDKGKKKAKTRWMLIGFGQSIEVKLDEEEEVPAAGNKIEKPEVEISLDSFYDPICNLGIGRKGGLIQYLRMVGRESQLQKGQENIGEGTAGLNKKIVRKIKVHFISKPNP